MTTSMTFRAHVKNGRLVLDEPTDLPEGTEVALEPVIEPSLDAAAIERERVRIEAWFDGLSEAEKQGFDALADLDRKPTA